MLDLPMKLNHSRSSPFDLFNALLGRHGSVVATALLKAPTSTLSARTASALPPMAMSITTLGPQRDSARRTAGHRCFAFAGEASTTSAGHSAPWSIHARSSATSSVVSAGNLSRTALGGISESGDLPDT